MYNYIHQCALMLTEKPHTSSQFLLILLSLTLSSSSSRIKKVYNTPSCTIVRIFNFDLYIFLYSRNKRKKASPADSKQRSRKKKKQLELKNFYRFQIRQEKVEKLEELRQKFEEDKQRVAMMKESRKFKPF